MNSPEKVNVYDEITQKIIEALEEGVAPWHKPWVTKGECRNAVTNRPYRGINTLILLLTMYRHDFTDSRWLTFRQVKEKGGYVRKGERGTGIIFWKFLKKSIDNNTDDTPGDEHPENGDEGDVKIIAFAKRYTVFNVEQCDGLTLPPLPEHVDHDPGERNAIADQLIAVAHIKHGCDKACYVHGHDIIMLPNAETFDSMDNYYATALHELVHWTRLSYRLNRDFRSLFKTAKEAYALEELVAEIGASFLGTQADVPFEGMQHAEYVGSWLQALKNDTHYIFKAASKAQAAADYLLERAGLVEEKNSGEEEAQAAA